jgi:hypothetical protein
LDPDQIFVNASWPTACSATNDVITHTVRSMTLDDGIYVQLTYSGGTNAGCRTIAASLYVPNYSGSKACGLTLVRTSDGKAAWSPIVHSAGFWGAETPSLYDAAVVSYASVTCTYGGHTYIGRTGSY